MKGWGGSQHPVLYPLLMYRQGGSEQQHAYLILSRRDSSMVLQTGQEINELDSSGFATTQTTVFAGNLGGESTL